MIVDGRRATSGGCVANDLISQTAARRPRRSHR